ncbi:MAG TPA: cupredoxin domain-containing protein [Nitrososphaerales archaeon]|nr:cupredoxin domain-containing protein [Nitrososphaerales archaeon]
MALLDRRTFVAVLVAVIVVSSVIVVAYFLTQSGSPPVKQPGTFLIIADANGFNDSINHGVPQNSWPIITVQKGTNVTITVSNTDLEAHGFQVAHYFESSIQTVAPGTSLKVSFVADQTGSFRIYCSIVCGVHAFMQSGELVVQ